MRMTGARGVTGEDMNARLDETCRSLSGMPIISHLCVRQAMPARSSPQFPAPR